MNFFMRVMLAMYHEKATPEPLTEPVRQGNTSDPMKIIGKESVDPTAGIDPVDYLRTDSLYGAISDFVTMMSVVIIMGLLITMLFVSKSEKLAEKKQDIMHKLLIVFIATSLISILNFAVEFMRYLFTVPMY